MLFCFRSLQQVPLWNTQRSLSKSLGTLHSDSDNLGLNVVESLNLMDIDDGEWNSENSNTDDEETPYGTSGTTLVSFPI